MSQAFEALVPLSAGDVRHQAAIDALEKYASLTAAGDIDLATTVLTVAPVVGQSLDVSERTL